jgi:hypothetical protein
MEWGERRKNLEDTEIAFLHTQVRSTCHIILSLLHTHILYTGKLYRIPSNFRLFLRVTDLRSADTLP